MKLMKQGKKGKSSYDITLEDLSNLTPTSNNNTSNNQQDDDEICFGMESFNFNDKSSNSEFNLLANHFEDRKNKESQIELYSKPKNEQQPIPSEVIQNKQIVQKKTCTMQVKLGVASQWQEAYVELFSCYLSIFESDQHSEPLKLIDLS